MASHLREALLDEIALEGLDGITVNTLWIRLNERPNFTFSIDDNSKQYLWNCVLGLKTVDFYKLSKPRADLVPYNRFHYIDPETKHFLETDDIPEDIYPVKVVTEVGVMGSCMEYATRVKVTDDIRTTKPSLDNVMKKYGCTLVIVASQQTRLRTLIGLENDPNFDFSPLCYALLERIGRSRYMGEASFGNLSLQVFGETHKTMYYLLKKLRGLKMMRKQRLCVIKKPSNMKTTCFLYQLNRFYKEVGNRRQFELINMATYLSKKPEQMEEALKVRNDLKLFDIFKKLSQLTTSTGEKYFDFLNLPWRRVHPDAKPRDYMMKNQQREKTIRYVRLLMSLDDVHRSLKENDQESEDEEDEDEEIDLSPMPEYTYKRVFDQPNLYQLMQLINQAGPRGMSQVELRKIMNSSRLAVRRMIKILERSKYVTMVMADRGRQKTMIYISTDSVKENESHISVNEEIKKLQNSFVEKVPKEEMEIEEKTEMVENTEMEESSEMVEKNEEKGKQAKTKSSKGKAKRDVPIVRFNEEIPTTEKVTEIQKELDRLEETQHVQISEKSLAKKRQIFMDLEQDSGIKLLIEENIPEPMIDKKTGQQVLGMKRFGNLLTESHIRRANWMLEVLTAIKCVESFRLLKLLRNREKEMNLMYNMDQKSLKRLNAALYEEKKLRSYKAYITVGEKTRELTYVCDWSMSTQDERLLRMIEEAKLRHFSISKEELKSRVLIRNQMAKARKEKERITQEGIPDSALEAIKKHQEYRQKLVEKVPPMKYDRNAGRRYGLLPKMLRIQMAHQYLFYLCYDTHGQKIKSTGSGDKEANDQSTNTKENPSESVAQWKAEDALDVLENTEEVVDKEPPVYVNEMTWKRYLPPIPVHIGYPKGWCLLSDVLMNLPVSLFCQIVNVCYDIEGLQDVLNHPKKRFFPVICLPFKLTQQLLHSKKYVQAFFEMCAYLAEMGLVSFGKEVLKDKDQTFVSLHQNASLLNTKDSLKGYNKTRAPDDKPFPAKTFRFEQLSDLGPYWEFLQITAINSNLGHKSMVQDDLEDERAFEVKSLKQASAAFTPETVEDNGLIPGDQRGAAGLDSSLFAHTIKNWSCGHSNLNRHYRKYSVSLKLKGLDLAGSEVKPEISKTSIKGRERLVLSENPDKPVTLKKVVRDNVGGNKGGKGIVRPSRTKITTTSTQRYILGTTQGRLIKRRNLKFYKPKIRKLPSEKGDEKDKAIYRDRCKQRVMWSLKEDSVILMCRLATLIMDNKKKISLISYMAIRDYLHQKCGKISHDKTSQAVMRRIKFVLKNPQTETNLLLYYREAMSDEFVLKNFVSKGFILTDQNLHSEFRILVDYLLDKFKALDLQKCTLPDNLTELRQNYVIQYIGKLKTHKVYHDVKNKADICQDVLRNILHSAVLLDDKQGRTHEMFKLLNQYPDTLLGHVVKELRNDGLFVINKKHYVTETMNQLSTGMGLRNFKVSQRYLYHYKHRYLSTMFDESAKLLQDVCDRYLHEEEEREGGEKSEPHYLPLPYHPTSGECAMLFPLILNRELDFRIKLPEELVIIDMDGFYKFPWGRGKKNFQTKGDKYLKVLKQAQASGKDDSKSRKTTGDKEKPGEDIQSQSIQPMDYDDESDEELHPFAKKTDSVKKSIDESVEGGQSSVSDEIKVDNNIESSEKTVSSDGKQNNSNEMNLKDETGTFTHVLTNSSHVIISKKNTVSEPSIVGVVSAMASRTLLSLQRTDNLSVDEIRIFNAQDNFVVKSCTIDVRIKDKLGPTDFNVCVKSSAGTDLSKEEEDKEAHMMSEEEKRQHISRLILDKDKVKSVYTDLQRLLPFQFDVENVWTELKTQGATEADMRVYKEVFYTIDSHSELGIRSFDLQKQYGENVLWHDAVDVLVRHSAVLKVGVTCTRYVSLNHARPWVIHAYRNIRGRGLHIDEDKIQAVPIDKVDDKIREIEQEDPYFYTEKVSAERAGSYQNVAGTKANDQNEDANKDTTKIKPDSSKKIIKKKRPVEGDDANIQKPKKRKLSNEDATSATASASTTQASDPVKSGEEKGDVNRTADDSINSSSESNEIQQGASRNDLNANENNDNSEYNEHLARSEINEKKEQCPTTDRIQMGAEPGSASDEMKGRNQNLSSDALNADCIQDDRETRKLRKRKLPKEDGNECNPEDSFAVSTYDKVRLVIQPWRKPEGGVNKPILKMMMESLMLYLMMHPGSTEDALCRRYTPYLQPMVIRNVLDILEDIGCITKHCMKKRTVTLFTKPTLSEIGKQDDEDSEVMILPTEYCVLRMGQFGLEIFPHAKWPEVCTRGIGALREKNMEAASTKKAKEAAENKSTELSAENE